MIPKIIFQTIPDRNNIHPAFVENIKKIKALNPGWDYQLYDNFEYRSYITDSDLLRAYDKINPEYGVGQANIFKYWMTYKWGGVYLDIKSTVIKPLDTVLLPNDQYLLSHWNQVKYPDWGIHPELGSKGEYQQWYLVAAPQHPFLAAVLEECVRCINRYDPIRVGVGKKGEIRVSGAIPYTLAIQDIQHKYPYRSVNTEDTGFEYSIFDKPHTHEICFQTHYTSLTTPIVINSRQN